MTTKTLNFSDLQSAGAFVGPAVKREITFIGTDGKENTFNVFIRQASYETVTEQWQAQAEQKNGMAARIANMVVNEAGEPILTLDQIAGTSESGAICESLTIALLHAIGEVNKVATPEVEEKK